MVSVRRVVSVWGVLHLSIGSGLMALTQSVFEQTVPVPVVAGSVGALLTAVVLLHRYPELESSAVRRFGFLTLMLFIIGNVVVANGLYAPVGESSPLTIGLLWLGSMALAYELSVGGGYERILKRFAFR